MTTTHSFTKLGFRTMPIAHKGCRMVRLVDTPTGVCIAGTTINVNVKSPANGKKQIIDAQNEPLSFSSAMPSNWTHLYGDKAKEHSDTPLGGLICGSLSNKLPHEVEVIALDCDNALAWETFKALHPDYKFRFASIGKDGGTILYALPDALRDIPQFSLTGELNLEYMARRASGANAMVYLPTTANETKEDIVKGAELEEPPQTVITLIKALQPKQAALPTIVEQSSTSLLPFNAPLVKQYVLESKAAADKGQVFGKIDSDSQVAQKVYKVFTPRDFRQTQPYQTKGYIHPNDPALLEAGPYSKYITGVSAIAGADQSIDSQLYVDFMQALNSQIDDPYAPDRYLVEVIQPMVNGKATINNQPIWKYNENWDQNSHSISNQYGETLEYFASELEASLFIEYNHTTKSVVYIRGVNPLLDRIYTMDADPQQEKPSKSLVKKLKLVREEHSVKLEPGIFINSDGRTIINTEEARLPLRILRSPDLFSTEVTETNLYVRAFNLFLQHLVGDDEVSQLFLKQLIAYHGRHLDNIPVIIYMVGVGGAGKSQFSNILEALFGANTTRRPNPKQLTGQFNDFLENCALLVLTETADASQREQEGIKSVLKTVTGEKSIDIEAKGRPLRPNVPMFALPLLLANSLWYQEDTADRRIFPIQPAEALHKSDIISAFEHEHDIKIVPFILEGIKLGYISKYLTTFCPDRLPEVPTTATKKDFAFEQTDPILQVKALVQHQEHAKLFDLFEEYDITAPLSMLERNVRNYGYYQQHLIDLVIALKEGDFYPTDSSIKKAFRPNSWLEMRDYIRPNTNSTGPAAYKNVGRYLWVFDDVKDIYEQWKIEKLKEGE